MQEYIDLVLPKKDAFRLVKCHEHLELLVNSGGQLLFFRQREGPWCPTLKLLHQYPFMLPHERVDKGAIKFVLSGANIMCPGIPVFNAYVMLKQQFLFEHNN
jgi:PUA domain protein